MRHPINPDSKCKTKGISIPPELDRAASKRAFSAGLSFSKYVQLLIDLDLDQGILAQAIARKLNNAAQ